MNLFSKVNHIPTKYVIGMNLAILVLAGTFISINSVNQTTEHRSQAAENPLPSPLSQIIARTDAYPALTAPDPDWAKVGDAILVRGSNLGTTPFGSLFIGDTPVPFENIVEWNPDSVVFTVPENAITAPIIVKAIVNQESVELSTQDSLKIVTQNLQ